MFDRGVLSRVPAATPVAVAAILLLFLFGDPALPVAGAAPLLTPLPTSNPYLSATTTRTATRTPSPKITPTRTRTKTATRTATPTRTRTRTSTVTASGVQSQTATRTRTATTTPTRTRTATTTATRTRTATPTVTRTRTATAAATSAAAATLSPVTWVDLVGVSASGGTLTKTGGVAYQFDAGALSRQRIVSGDSFLEVTVDDSTSDVYAMVGFSSGDPAPGYDGIDFAIYMAGWTLKVFERGDDRGSFGSYAPGDKLRVAVQAGKVNYYHNGVRFYSSTLAPLYPLYADSSIADPEARILNARIYGGNMALGIAPTATPTGTATPPPAPASVGTPPPAISCQMFPANNIWNRDIAALPVAANSAAYLATMGNSAPLHPDFGSRLWQGETIGLFYSLVGANQARVPVLYTAYGAQSDPGPYPIPANARVQGGASSTGDRHVLALDTQNCVLYELFKSYPQSDGSWQAKAGAIWDLKSNNLRPNGWTSADAAGFAVLPGLVRYDEIERGAINHAIRFTTDMSNLSKSWIWPARHSDGTSTSAAAPPMGTRLRLKASFDISNYPLRLRIILTALQKYGMILADSGGPLNIGGVTDPRWDDDELHLLEAVQATDFEVVDESGLMISPDSGQSR